MACTCKDIIPQSKECYAQQIVVKVPEYLDIRMNAPGRERKEYVALDPCITAEVIQLWRLGIVTTGACCGHNLPDGFQFIGVEDEFIPKMKELGYEVAHNKCRPDDEDSFVPKSVGGKTATKELAALPIFDVSKSFAWGSKELIGDVQEHYKNLEHKGWDWRSFYNGWLEGRFKMLGIMRGWESK